MPQGLPFYSGGAISAANRPYLGSMDLTQIPFEFPGNRERLGERLLPDENALAQLLQGKRRVWIVSLGGTMERFHSAHSAMPLRFVTRVGESLRVGLCFWWSETLSSRFPLCGFKKSGLERLSPHLDMGSAGFGLVFLLNSARFHH
jgi:hypothetical protein